MQTIRKSIIWALLFFTVFTIPVVPESGVAHAASVAVTAPSAVLIDPVNNRLLYAKTPHRKRPPASTTKILTAMVAMDMLSLNKVVTVPDYAESIEPSKIFVRGGEQYYVRDLIRATLIKSANDAAEVLAYAAAGSRSAFAEKMNKKARSIGARHSHFVNPHGLPDDRQYSTAYDLALIMDEAQKYPFLVSTLKSKTTMIYSRSGRKIYLKNHNKMLWRDSREIIGKTGWTRKARHCFVGQIRVYDKKVLVAMMGSLSLWRDLKILADYQFGLAISKIRSNRKLWGRHETKKIQSALKRTGFYSGDLDGQFGPETVRAIEQYQAANDLKVDGVVGKITYKKLMQQGAHTESKSEQIQRALQRAGLDPGPVDGYLGPQTTRAIRAFQKRKGLTQDGIVGPATWKSLQSYL